MASVRRPASLGVQAKLKIGPVDDPLEREADRVADQVLRSPSAPGVQLAGADELQRQMPEEEEEELQMMPKEEEEELQMMADGSGSRQPSPTLSSRVQQLRSGGEPMSPSVRSYFEPRFGVDFSGVRIHRDSQAATTAHMLRAKAFTAGRHITFGEQQYRPETSSGRRLIAHELTHVIQQGKAGRGGNRRS